MYTIDRYMEMMGWQLEVTADKQIHEYSRHVFVDDKEITLTGVRSPRIEKELLYLARKQLIAGLEDLLCFFTDGVKLRAALFGRTRIGWDGVPIQFVLDETCKRLSVSRQRLWLETGCGNWPETENDNDDRRKLSWNWYGTYGWFESEDPRTGTVITANWEHNVPYKRLTKKEYLWGVERVMQYRGIGLHHDPVTHEHYSQEALGKIMAGPWC